MAIDDPQKKTRALGDALTRSWRKRLREKVPFTNLGLAVILLASVAYWGFGLPRVDYVVQLVSVFALALVGLALAFVIPGAFSLHRRLGDIPEASSIHFEAKRGYATLLRLPAMRWLPFVELSWDWIQPQGFKVNIEAQASHYVEVVEALQRGQYERIHRRFVLEDAFGLVRLVLYRSETRNIRVLPWKGLVENSTMLRAHAGGDELSHPAGEKIGDRIDIRRYQPGDPLKWVLWKIFARTGQMMVRTPERAISPSVRVLAYLPSCENDEPAAAAARVAVSTQLLSTDWRFRADGSNETALDEDAAMEQIVRSRTCFGTDAAEAGGLEAFLAADSEIGGSRLVLFLPATPGPWLDNCLEAISGHDFPVTAVVCTDGVEEAAQKDSSRYEHWLRRQDELSSIGHFSTTQEQLNEVIDRLGAAQVDVVGVERPNGRILRTATWQALHGRQRGAA